MKKKSNKRRLIAVFGYGSLVNEATVEQREHCSSGRQCFGARLSKGVVIQPKPPRGYASLSGYRRSWMSVDTDLLFKRGKSWGKHSPLTVIPDPSASIQGVLMLYENDGRTLQQLDYREKAYHRVEVDREALSVVPPDLLKGVEAVYLYKSLPEYARYGGFEFPILQSYCDAVLLGYFQRWGTQGVRDFIATTDGWKEVPILQDRLFPRYPRHIPRTTETVEAMKIIDAIFDELVRSQMQSFRVAMA